MWDLADEVGALLVFAEHRFYGKSQPFAETTPQTLQYLTSEQARRRALAPTAAARCTFAVPL